jgi:glycosyltransferase involved in cell wall biosynthesis
VQPIQIVECYDFVRDEDVSGYFELADIVLAPYQRHVGMSGILLLAAAAGKPVLSSNYGLMGELVRRYHLGLTVNSTILSEITEGLVRCLLEAPEGLGDRTKMRSFVEQNSAKHYASTIFQYL